MGKPYVGDDWEQAKADEKKKRDSPPAAAEEKFTKSFQDYLDTIASEQGLRLVTSTTDSPPLCK